MRAWIWLLTLSAGCDLPDTDTDSERDLLPTSVCPEGYSQATTASLSSFSLVVDGLNWFVTFEDRVVDPTYGASACISDTALGGRFTLFANNAPWGYLWVQAPESGPQSMNKGACDFADRCQQTSDCTGALECVETGPLLGTCYDSQCGDPYEGKILTYDIFGKDPEVVYTFAHIPIGSWSVTEFTNGFETAINVSGETTAEFGAFSAYMDGKMTR